MLLAGWAAWAQVPSPGVNPGSIAQNLGTVALAGSPATATLTFTFTSGGTLGGSPAVLTMGAPGLDFKDAGTGSLTVQGAHTYRAGDTGTVDVVFSPTAPGTRYGAVVLRNGGGAVVATTFLKGTGTGPQVVIEPADGVAPWSQVPVPLPAINPGDRPPGPTGVAVDGAGRIYVADPANNRVVLESLPTGGTQTVVYAPPAPPGTPGPAGVALDGAGNVYIADTPNNQVLKMTPRQIQTGLVFDQARVLGGLNGPQGVAVDGAGNVFVADTGNNQVVMAAWSGTAYAPAVVVDAALAGPGGVLVDGAGNVFIADSGEGAVWMESPAGGGYTRIALPGLEGFSGPVGLAINPAGEVLVAENQYGPIILNTPQGGAYTSGRILYAASLNTPYGMAMDSLGNLLVADPGNNQVLRIDLADPPDLTFASTPVGVPSPDSPQAVQIWNIGNADLTLPVPAAGADPAVPAGWSLDAGTTLTTTTRQSGTPGVLAAGTSATLAIDFTPVHAGPAQGSLVLTDTALNAAGPAYAAQTILLSGSAPGIYVTPPVLPHGQVGADYAQALAGAGGTGPYTFSLASGTLPTGLGLGAAGDLAGTPTATGTFPFTVLATDSTPATGSYPLSLTIDPGAASVTLGALSRTYTGSPLAATATTTPPGLAVAITYDGGSALPVDAGSHAVVATVTDPDYRGSASGTLVIAKAAGTVALAGLGQTYDGLPRVATATTIPPGLGVAFTYDGGAAAPSAAGSYAVVGSITDGNYQGSSSGTLVIAKAAGTVTLGGLAQSYTGAPLAATAITVPAGLGVAITYNGGVSPPTAPGSYAVSATITNADYQGSASGTLVISETGDRVVLTVTGDDHLGDPEILTAIVTGGASPSRAAAAAAPVPTGTVTFLDGTTVLAVVPLTGGTATFTTRALAEGPHLLSAVYSGDATFPGGASNKDAEVVVPPALAIQAPEPDLELGPGGVVTAELTLGSLGPITGETITLSATDLPPGILAEFSPAVLTTLPATVLLRFRESDRALAGNLTRPGAPEPGPRGGAFLASALLLLALPGARRRAGLILAGLVLAFGLACGHGRFSGPQGGAPLVRPSGTYTVTVTATAPRATLATCVLHLTIP